MKLLVYEKFMDGFIELPKGIQKKVLSFQKKFRENSKSSGIHLEPISTFRDSSLRSARIDGSYRAIIKAPENGETYFLLWVDHHDKAYDWAQNKVFQWNVNTQAMQMIEMSREIEEPVISGYQEQGLAALSEFSDEELEKIGVPGVLMASIRAINGLEDLEKLERYIPDDAFENLFYLLDGASIHAIISEVEEGKIHSDDFEDQLVSVNNQRSFIELTDDELFNQVLEGDFEKWKYYLHPSQRKIVFKDNKGPVKITGGAGTGKTVAAIHRLKYLTDRHPSAKILFTTYTKNLTQNLKDLIRGWNINNGNVEINNIDNLAFSLAIQFGIIADGVKVMEYEVSKNQNSEEIFEDILLETLSSFNASFFYKEWKDVILHNDVSSLVEYYNTSRRGRHEPIGRRQKKEIWSVFQQYKKVLKLKKLIHKDQLFNAVTSFLRGRDKTLYDFVIVDELQDFSNVELRLVRALVPEKPNDLFLVGDPLQKVYNTYINFSQAGINIRGRRSQRLRINYRTSEEIKKLALSVIREDDFDDFEGGKEDKSGYISIFHGQDPTIESFKSRDVEIQYIHEYINDLKQNSSADLSDIAICSRTNSALKEIKKEIHTLGLKYGDRSGEHFEGHMNNGVQLVTMHSIKGLEFKHIIISDLGKQRFPLKGSFYEQMSATEQKEHIKREKALLYVAISRARETVLITGIGEVEVG